VRPNVPHNCVFCSSKDGKPLTPSGLSQIIRRLCKKAGLKRKLGAHAFRHYVGKRFGHEHVPVRTAQAYLGHSDPSITYGYYQDVDEEDLHRAAQILDFPEAQQKKTDDGKIIPLFPAS
jgi:integrase